jgi:hypothetical protein
MFNFQDQFKIMNDTKKCNAGSDQQNVAEYLTITLLLLILTA